MCNNYYKSLRNNVQISVFIKYFDSRLNILSYYKYRSFTATVICNTLIVEILNINLFNLIDETINFILKDYYSYSLVNLSNYSNSTYVCIFNDYIVTNLSFQSNTSSYYGCVIPYKLYNNYNENRLKSGNNFKVTFALQ